MIVSCLRLFVVLVHITDVRAPASVPTNNLDIDIQPVRDAVDVEDIVFDGLYFNAVMYVCLSFLLLNFIVTCHMKYKF